MPSTYIAENYTLNRLFGAASAAPPSTWYVGLATGSPINESGTISTEVSGGNYARVAIPNDGSHFGAAINGVKSNSLVIQFPVSTAEWGLITHILIWDSSTGGNLWYWDELSTPQQIDNGNIPVFSPTGLQLKNTIAG